MTKFPSFTILVFFLSLGQPACDDSSQSGSTKKDDSAAHEHDADGAGAAAHDHDSPAAGGASGSGEMSGSTESADSAAPGTFTHIYEDAFKTCRTQCHGMGYSMLDMKTRDSAYSALVDHDTNPSNMKCAPLGLKRVKPGAPSESLLYLKLDINAPCGQQMPPGGQLSQAFRDEVRDWIMNGAKDD